MQSGEPQATVGGVRTAWVFAALLGVLVVGYFDRIVDSLVFQPSPGVDLEPARFAPSSEQVFLTTEDAVRIHAFWLPTAKPHAAGPDRAVLFLHGNAGNASHRLPNAAALAHLDTHVLLLDYRGYGRSHGQPSEAGVYADARAGLAHLVEERGIDPRRVVVFGRSLGSAVAVELARERTLAGLVLESAMTSIADVASGVFGRPVGWLVRGRFDSAAKIADVRCPLLFFHGDRDEVVDHKLGWRLFELAPSPKVFETLRGAAAQRYGRGRGPRLLCTHRPFLGRSRTALNAFARGEGVALVLIAPEA